MTDEQFQAMIDIHTVVPFRVARALAPHWREAAKAERGEDKEVFRKLINVSSTSGTMGNAGQVNYSAAKMGVVGLTKTLAKEWGQFKINVNAVAFGFVDTRLTAAKEEGGEMTSPTGEKIELGIPEQMRAMASAIIPIGRPATPEEASGPVLFLASPLANYIHGQTINVTGGHVRGDVHLSDAGSHRGQVPGPLPRRGGPDLAADPSLHGRAHASSTASPGAASDTRSPVSAARCCCSTTSAPRAAPGGPRRCSTSGTATTWSSSPPKAASPSTRPGTTT